ncbi:MAG: oligosaccharide flippase family protein [Methylococcaceae bacterium]|nr:oligosaccharide flippase family protein [Methylococcaceae bacterium]
MYKSLLKDASLYSISSLIARGFSLITVPIYTRLLKPADYGALDLLSYLVILVPLIMGAALDQALARFYNDAADDNERKRISSSILLYTVFIFVPFIPLALPLSSELAHGWLKGQVKEATILLVFLLIWINAIYTITNNQLIYSFKSRQFAICSIGNTVFSVSTGFLLVAKFRLGVHGILLGQLLGISVFTLLSLYFGRINYSLHFDWKTLRRMMAFSLPLVPGTLAFYLMQYVDRYAINQMSGLDEVGLYGIGARVASLINLFLMGFQGAWNPVIMSTYREPGAPKKFRVVFNYYLFVVCAILVGLSLFGKEILLVLTTRTFSQGFIVIPLLLLAAILSSIGQYFTYGILIAKKSGLRLYLNLMALVINAVLVYVLIPRFGMMGAALATVLAFVFLTVVGLALSQRYYHVPYRWRKIITAAVVAVMVSNLVFMVDFELTVRDELAKIGLILVVLLFFARLLDIKLDPRLLGRARASLATQVK